MGGLSTEREVSIQSGRAMESSLRRQGYTVMSIMVDRDVAERLRSEKVELAIIALHGRFGEDGTIQGLLEITGIPYTGSGVLASAIGINKIMTKRLLQYYELPTPRYTVIDRSSPPEGLPEGFTLPVVVKPPTQGSTLGITIVRDPEAISTAYREAFHYDDEILVEEYIAGREITAGILEDQVLPLIEIIAKSGFYDFNAKYTKGMTDYIVPARIPDELVTRIQALAMKVHRGMGCNGCTRVDFRVSQNGEPTILEINTVPGMTETSLLPKAAKAAGMDYDALVTRIVEMALKKEGVSNGPDSLSV